MPDLANEVLVQRFAGVFFEVRAHQAHRLFLVAQEEFDRAALHHRDLELADLVALGQVGVEVVLAGKNAARRHMGTNGQAELDGAFDRALVHHRQCAGQRQVHRAGLRVRLGTEGGGGTAENLALGGELGMGFKADDDFITRHQRAGGAALLLGFKGVHNGLAHLKCPPAWRRASPSPAAGGAPHSAVSLPANSCQ